MTERYYHSGCNIGKIHSLLGTNIISEIIISRNYYITLGYDPRKIKPKYFYSQCGQNELEYKCSKLKYNDHLIRNTLRSNSSQQFKNFSI